MSPVILAIDDEPHNLMLIESYLEGTGYHVEYFNGAADALLFLRTRPSGAADTILLDRMMPGMDGMAFMRELKKIPAHATVPVIMQTAASGASEVAEGIAAGVYYYLPKPYGREVLNAIVARALQDHSFHKGLEKTVAQMTEALGHTDLLRIPFRTLDDVRSISFFLASLYPDPGAIRLGITELMLNAVEHGNLGIRYAEKSELVEKGTWHTAVEQRLQLPEYRRKRASATFEREPGAIVLTIEDQGAGFEWQSYMELDPARALDAHGRGIAMSRLVSFDRVTYVAPGNKVLCRKNV
jgi:CheY-like chemotaxis protein/anti-sigma regulatory factor (Ser/Thr protein kinase)